MIRMVTPALAFVAVAVSSIACAKPAGYADTIQERDLLSGKEKIEPESGYVYIRSPIPQGGVLLLLPDEAAIARYEAEWAAALAVVQQKYPAKLEDWEFRTRLAHGKGQKLPEKPIEPTPENFSIGPIEERNPVFYGLHISASTESPQSYSYLLRVEPGRYAYYGPISKKPGGLSGTCYCMGTVSFEVKAGRITDTGKFFPGGMLAFGLPASLQSYPNEQADFRAHGKLDNFFGLAIGRMPRVAGILAYDRDKVIDLKAQAEAASAATPDAGAVETTPVAATGAEG